MRVIGYVRVSTEEQGQSGAGIEAQKTAILNEARRRDWHHVTIIEDVGVSGRDLNRPGIRGALEALERGEASALVVAKLDRLSRSMLDFAGIMEVAQRQGWALVALDVSVDTSTPAGEAMANVMATFAQFERRLIGQRTREALAEKRKQGVRLGRPPAINPELAKRIRAEREKGATLREIADRLNAEASLLLAAAENGGHPRWKPCCARHRPDGTPSCGLWPIQLGGSRSQCRPRIGPVIGPRLAHRW